MPGPGSVSRTFGFDNKLSTVTNVNWALLGICPAASDTYDLTRSNVASSDGARSSTKIKCVGSSCSKHGGGGATPSPSRTIPASRFEYDCATRRTEYTNNLYVLPCSAVIGSSSVRVRVKLPCATTSVTDAPPTKVDPCLNESFTRVSPIVPAVE